MAPKSGKTGFLVDHTIGTVWSNSKRILLPPGAAVKGYISYGEPPVRRVSNIRLLAETVRTLMTGGSKGTRR